MARLYFKYVDNMMLHMLITAIFVVLGFALGTVSEQNFTVIDARIVGGKPTEIEAHPHQVSIEVRTHHICSGSILGQYWVVTSAQCLQKNVPYETRVRVGSKYKEMGGDVYKVAKIIIHPYYKPDGLENDVGLLEIAQPIVYGKSVKPISMVTTIPGPGSPVVTTGWGQLWQGGTDPKQLHEVTTFVVKRDECHKLNHVVRPVTKGMMCAGYKPGGRSPCNGDTGGPLVYKGKLCGIVSWGVVCGSAEHPSVYANVAEARHWITHESGIY